MGHYCKMRMLLLITSRNFTFNTPKLWLQTELKEHLGADKYFTATRHDDASVLSVSQSFVFVLHMRSNNEHSS